ncbi:MAG TPA: pyridoxamine 5'-phosphate oxidase family protein [Gemmatimonadaceae bacterium]|nr:pyridoxamine 5'-phosphate oxidase family protein [Gemmatimonadaceae bacterium]
MGSMEDMVMTRKTRARKVPVIAPVFRDLTREDSESVLTCNHVGRMAYSFHDAVDIRPVHYVLDDNWLFGRTSPGDKLVTLQHHQWVAFEVDEISGPFDWKSVVAHGTFYRLEPGGAEPDNRLFERGMAAIRKVAPDALSEADPTPFRTELFGISLDSISGRSCSTKSRA